MRHSGARRRCTVLREVLRFDRFQPGLNVLPATHLQSSGCGIEWDMGARSHRDRIRRMARLAYLLAIGTRDDQYAQRDIVR